MNRRFLAAPLCVAVAGALAGAAWDGGPLRPVPATAAELAAALSAHPHLEEALAITRATLARAGIDSGTGSEVLVEGEAPRTGGYILPPQALGLALEARNPANRGRVNVAELGDILAAAGFPFAAGTTPGEQLLALLRGWTEAAAAHPDDPLAFQPLFIRELRLRRVPSVDLMADTVGPADVHLTLLELELLTSAFERLYAPEVKGAALLPRISLPGLFPLANPCEDFKEWMAANVDRDVDDAYSGTATATAVGLLLDKLVKKTAGADGAEKMGHMLAAVSIAATLQKTAAHFASAMIEVEPSDSEVHKPLSGTTPLEFSARLALNPEEIETYERELRSTSAAVRACMRQLGFPDYTTLADMVKDAENWRVHWELYSDPKHAHWNNANFDFPGQQDMRLRRVSATSIETRPFVTEVLPEARHEGQEAEAYIMAVATLRSDAAMDAIRTILTPRWEAPSTIAGAVDLLSGWARNVLHPEATYMVRITYHRPTLHLRITLEELRRGGGGYGQCAVGQVWEGPVTGTGGIGYTGELLLMSRSFVCNEDTEGGSFVASADRGSGVGCEQPNEEIAERLGMFRHRALVQGAPMQADTVRLVLMRTQRPPEDAPCQGLDRNIAEWSELPLPAARYPQQEGDVVEVETMYGIMRLELVPPAPGQ